MKFITLQYWFCIFPKHKNIFSPMKRNRFKVTYYWKWRSGYFLITWKSYSLVNWAKKADQSLFDVEKRVALVGKEKTWENLVFTPGLYSVSAFMIQSLLKLPYYEKRSWLNIYTRGGNGTLNSHWQCWRVQRIRQTFCRSAVFFVCQTLFQILETPLITSWV